MECSKHHEEKQDLFSNGEYYCESCFLETIHPEGVCEVCEEDADETYNDHVYCRTHYEIRGDL